MKFKEATKNSSSTILRVSSWVTKQHNYSNFSWWHKFSNDQIIRFLCSETILNDIWKLCPSRWIFKRTGKIKYSPIHKKNNQQIINLNRPVLLLRICGKLLERLIINSLYNYLEESKLPTALQSAFRYNDSRVSQLLLIFSEVYTASDTSPTPETREVFLDMSKAFVKCWHAELIY